MSSYYNEIDPFAADWLRALISKGLIPDGEVDTRSIVNVRADDVRGFAQCHFFAGIGGWSHALRLAGWADDRPVWTGSCPCQPFSVAGKGKGTADERHLWPVFFNLIRAARPPVVMGEQVAGAAGYGWFDGVAADLEAEDYACRALDLAACSVDAPHIRSRLWWCAVADADEPRLEGRRTAAECSDQQPAGQDGMADADAGRPLDPINLAVRAEGVGAPQLEGHSCDGDMADADGAEPRRRELGLQPADGSHRRYAPEQERASFWSDYEWRVGADGKARRVKPGVCLLADGVPHRVGRLRGYGNAIVPPLAAEVIGALMEVMNG